MGGGIILNSNSGKSVWDVDCIDLVQDRDSWNARVNSAMDLPISQNARNFLLAEELSASQGFLCCMELFRLLISGRHETILTHLITEGTEISVSVTRLMSVV